MPWGETYLEFIWANDGMNYLVPAEGLSRGRTFQDDNGFTNDLSACVIHERGDSRASFCGRHRMITERGGLLRADEVLAEATLQRRRALNAEWSLSSFVGFGAVATGPLGGAPFQDAFHRLIRWGRTLSGTQQGQLQNAYEGDVGIAPRLHVGTRVHRRIEEATHVSVGAEVVANPGAGASGGQLDLGMEHFLMAGKGGIRLFADLALRHLRAEEERLTFNGAYPVKETFLQPSAGISYRRGSREIGFALHLNIEGSGANQGAITFRQSL